MNYFKILLFMEKGNKGLFDFPKKEQMDYLNSLGEAKDDITRGYKQYLCQNEFVKPKWKIWVFNVGGAITLPIVLCYFLIKRIFEKKRIPIYCLIEKKGMPEVVPIEVREKYQPSVNYQGGTSLGIGDLGFICRLGIKAPHHPYFTFKAMMNVARYSDLIYRYHPKVMIQFGEFSFSSSVLTSYCHKHSVKHVNIMHGEKLYNIRDSFFHYDECYVWSEHYVRLLSSLKAEPTQFRVAIPPSLKIDCEKYKKPEYYADYKYYLAAGSEDTIRNIVAAMTFAKLGGKTIKYRPHPRYTDVNLLRKFVAEKDIEWPHEVNIQESIANLGCAVGSYTTVMIQAYFSGKQVIMDDVAQKKEYDVLHSLSYILSGDEFERLSNYQNV